MSATINASEYPAVAAARPATCSVPSVGLLRSWIDEAKPGERLTYHRGFLAVDRVQGSPSTARQRARLDILAKHMVAAAEMGLIHLLQSRLAAGTFHYIAVKAHARLPVPSHR